MDGDKLRQDRIDAWAQVRALLAAVDELVREARRLAAQHETPAGDAEAAAPPLAQPPRAAAGAGPPGRAGVEAREPEGRGPPRSYIRRRQAVREALVGALRPALGRYLGELQADHCLLPLIVAFDERERLALGALAKRWSLPPLQLEQLDIDDGGDRFFDQLDEHLRGGGVHPLVFELYLLCLKGGFAGRYQGRPSERQAFETRLVDRIRREDPRRALASAPGAALAAGTPDGAPEAAAEPPGAGGGGGRRRKVAFVPFPYRYYLGAAGMLLAIFVVLRLQSSGAVARSEIGCACSASAEDSPAHCLGTTAHAP